MSTTPEHILRSDFEVPTTEPVSSRTEILAETPEASLPLPLEVDEVDLQQKPSDSSEASAEYTRRLSKKSIVKTKSITRTRSKVIRKSRLSSNVDEGS